MRQILFAFFFFYGCLLFASDKKESTAESRGYQFYLSWGYNRDWFSKSNLHFSNTSLGHDFIVEKVKAKDRSGFSQIIPLAKKFDFAVPQYNYRMGCFSKNRPDWGIEISFDHTKYVMVEDQTLDVKGSIFGRSIDTTMLVTPTGFLHFEHTNGANFLMANLMNKRNLLGSKNHRLMLINKLGAGIVIPKTFVIFLGEELDNKFHVAGYLAGLETSLRYQFHRAFIEFAAKGVFANYTNVLVLPGTKANHHFWCFEAIATAGAVIGRKY